jgi:trehalose 6-phosphate phosphatase
MRGGANEVPSDRQNLLDCWLQVSGRVRSAKRVALFLDFDGTLAPFRKRPEQVRMSDRTRRALRRLVREPRVRVFVLSGRRRADVKDRVRVRGILCFGLHGWEGPATAVPKRAGGLLRRARHELRNSVRGLRGVWIEKKGPVFALHVRGAAPEAVRRAGAAVRRVMSEFKPKLRVLPGNHVWEVMPRELQGKGATARALLRRMPAATLPIYAGDDTTDESAFAALRRGITICVGARQPTKARFDLHGPPEVCRFLEKLARELGA